MAPFDERSGQKLAYGMPIDMQKQWVNFKTICRRKNFSGRLLACCCLYYKIISMT